MSAGLPSGAARRVLEERARRLAQVEEAQEAGGELEVVTFRLAGETYALESRFLRAVARLERPALLPGGDPSLFGVMAWRGDLLLLRDVRPVLGLAAPPREGEGHVLVVEGDRAAFGVVVDAPGTSMRIPLREVGPLPGGARAYVRGVTPDAVVVLDAAALLNLYE